MALGRIRDPSTPLAAVLLVCDGCGDAIEPKSPIDGHESCLDAEGCLVVGSVSVEPPGAFELEGGDSE